MMRTEPGEPGVGWVFIRCLFLCIFCCTLKPRSLRIRLNYREKKSKDHHTQRPHGRLLNSQWVTEEMEEEVRVTWRQNPGDAAGAVPAGRFVATQAHLGGRNMQPDLTLEPEKEQTNPESGEGQGQRSEQKREEEKKTKKIRKGQRNEELVC